MRNVTDKPAQRERISINPRLEKNLAAYIAAAVSAGVGLLAQPSTAEVVYTSADITIHDGPPNTLLDLNNDGIADLQFYSYASYAGRWLWVYGATNSNSALQAEQGKPCAADLAKGVLIGPRRQFGGEVMIQSSPGKERLGYWDGVEHRYLGVRFKIDGKTHYGWVRMSVPRDGYSAVVTGYAYETVPNRPIVSGQTSGTYSADSDNNDAENQPAPAAPAATTLGALAVGAAAKK